MIDKRKPLLIVIAGPNGSGKTTITSKLLKHEWLEDAVYVNPDNVARDKFGDWNSPEAVLNAAKFCAELREQCLVERKSLIFETVLSAPDKVDFIKRAISLGYFVRLFFVSTENPQINASRIAKRVMEGGHDVPISLLAEKGSLPPEYKPHKLKAKAWTSGSAILAELAVIGYLYGNNMIMNCF